MSDPAVMEILLNLQSNMLTKEDGENNKKDMMSVMEAQFDAASQRAGKAEECIQSLISKFATMSTDVSDLNAKLQGVQDRLAAVEAKTTSDPMDETVDSDGVAVEPSNKKLKTRPMTSGSSSSGYKAPSPTPTSATTGYSDMYAYNDCIMWIKGFPHDIMQTAMKKHADLILKEFSPLATDVKFKGMNFRRQYSLEFPSKIQAIAFKEKADALGIEWLNPRDQNKVKLKVMGDKSITRRVADSILYFVYPLVEKQLKENGKLNENMSLGNSGNPRKFFVIDEKDEGWTLFTINVIDARTATMDPHYDELMHFGIGKETADAIAAEATSSAMKRRGA